MLGHVGQAQNDFILDQHQDIKALGTHDTLDDIVGLGVQDIFGFQGGLGLHHFEPVGGIDRPLKRLKAPLAFQRGLRLYFDPQKMPATRIFNTLHRPGNHGIELLGQIAYQAFEPGNRRLAVNLLTQAGKLVRIDVLCFHLRYSFKAAKQLSSTKKTLDNSAFSHSQSNQTGPSPLMRLILASSSPYRKEMLERLCVPFTTVAPDVDESPMQGETPAQLALRLSMAKAQAVVQTHPGAIVIGSDQVATVDGAPIGKPGSFERAKEQLVRLSGRTVEFHSALCVSDGRRYQTDDIVTFCRFRSLTDEEITRYLQREQPYDTAGSAKAEGLGIALMDSMRCDDPTAIIGLPLIALSRMLRSFGINPLAQP